MWRSSFGADDEFTLVLSRHLANALRALGEYSGRPRPQPGHPRSGSSCDAFGEDHEHSLATANSVGADLRLTGQFQEALALDEEQPATPPGGAGGPDDPGHHPGHEQPCRRLPAPRQLHAVPRARRGQPRAEAGGLRPRPPAHARSPTPAWSATSTGKGTTGTAWSWRRTRSRSTSSGSHPTHRDVLIARRHLAMLLRKAGYLGPRPSPRPSRRYRRRPCKKFGPEHEHSFSALMTLMNCQRVGRTTSSGRRAVGAPGVDRLRELLGTEHPFTFACMVDLSHRAAAHRSAGRGAAAHRRRGWPGLTAALGDDHPYTLCAITRRRTGWPAAQRAGRRQGRRRADASSAPAATRGEDHPYTLACAVNLALDLDGGRRRRAVASRCATATSSGSSGCSGTSHPDTANVGLYIRTESEIEVPAT